MPVDENDSESSSAVSVYPSAHLSQEALTQGLILNRVAYARMVKR